MDTGAKPWALPIGSLPESDWTSSGDLELPRKTLLRGRHYNEVINFSAVITTPRRSGTSGVDVDASMSPPRAEPDLADAHGAAGAGGGSAAAVLETSPSRRHGAGGGGPKPLTLKR